LPISSLDNPLLQLIHGMGEGVSARPRFAFPYDQWCNAEVAQPLLGKFISLLIRVNFLLPEFCVSLRKLKVWAIMPVPETPVHENYDFVFW